MTEQKYRQRGYREGERSGRGSLSGPSDRPARLPLFPLLEPQEAEETHG